MCKYVFTDFRDGDTFGLLGSFENPFGENLNMWVP